MVRSMAIPDGATQPLPLTPRLQRQMHEGRDLARFVYRADQRAKHLPPAAVFGDQIPEVQRAQCEARARVAVRMGDPANIAGALDAAAQAILLDIADRVGQEVLDAGDWETHISDEDARHLAKVAYVAAFNHLAGLHLVGREGV